MKKLLLFICTAAMMTACGEKENGNNNENNPTPGTQYTISAQTADHGTIEILPAQAAEGDQVTLNAVPDEGYIFRKWVAISGTSGVSGKVINPVTFTMPASDVVVTAQFAVSSDNSDPNVGIAINGVTWATRNVDAPGTFASHPEDWGMYYQFNRRTGWNSTDPNKDPAWDGVADDATAWASENDPCPEGWRMPINSDFTKLLSADYEWTAVNGQAGYLFTTTNGETLFLSAAGLRLDTTGRMTNPGRQGCYWTATSFNTADGYNVVFDSQDIYGRNNHVGKAVGGSVRCVKK